MSFSRLKDKEEIGLEDGELGDGETFSEKRRTELEANYSKMHLSLATEKGVLAQILTKSQNNSKTQQNGFAWFALFQAYEYVRIQRDENLFIIIYTLASIVS